jgi:hypothetical protein
MLKRRVPGLAGERLHVGRALDVLHPRADPLKV